MRTMKKINTHLLKVCSENLGVSKSKVITLLLEYWENNELPITDYSFNSTLDSDDYEKINYDEIKLFIFRMDVQKYVSEKLKDCDVFYILMNNYLN